MRRQLRIRPLEEHDLPFADAVREAAGWNQTRDDWRRFLARDPSGRFVAEWNGTPAGTVTTTRYGTDLGWIGMMLVHPGFRRRGIASALMNHALDHLRQRGGVRCIKLDATREGEPVYARLGFRAEWPLSRWERTSTGKNPTFSYHFKITTGLTTAGTHSRSASKSPQSSLPYRDPVSGPIPQIESMPFDLAAFGVDRTDWLRRLLDDAKHVDLLRGQSGEPTAFGIIRSGSIADYLGPLTAASEPDGRALVEKFLPLLTKHTFWDIPEPCKTAVALAEGHGFRRVRPFVRMWTGDRHVTGKPGLQFALGDPATG